MHLCTTCDKSATSREQAVPPQEDVDWNRWITLQVRAHHDLSEGQRKAVERDYGMRGGIFKIKVRNPK